MTKLKEYLIGVQENLITEIIEVYSTHPEDFWEIIRRTEFRIDKIGGDNFEQKVRQFMQRCIHHESPGVVMKVFDILSKDTTNEYLKSAGDRVSQITGAKPSCPTLEEKIEAQQVNIKPLQGPNRVYEDKTQLAQKLLKNVGERTGQYRDAPDPPMCSIESPDQSRSLLDVSRDLLEKLRDWDGLAARALSLIVVLGTMEKALSEIEPKGSESEMSAEQQKKIVALIDERIDRFLAVNRISTNCSDAWPLEAGEAAGPLLEIAAFEESHQTLQNLLKSVSYLKKFRESNIFKRQEYDEGFNCYISTFVTNVTSFRNSLIKYIETGIRHQCDGIREALGDICPPKVASAETHDATSERGQMLPTIPVTGIPSKQRPAVDEHIEDKLDK